MKNLFILALYVDLILLFLYKLKAGTFQNASSYLNFKYRLYSIEKMHLKAYSYKLGADYASTQFVKRIFILISKESPLYIDLITV